MPPLFPHGLRRRRQLILAGIGLYLLLPVPLIALQSKTPVRRTAPTRASSPSPSPDPSPPVVDFQAIPDRESGGPDDTINVSLFVANKSAKTLTQLKVKLADLNFQEIQKPLLTESLPAYRSVTDKLIIKPTTNVTSGTHKLLLSLEYAWDGGAFVSAQPTTLTISVTRRFEEETKGFPGGTAAFFYLLLPIVPAILSYQFFEGLRKGEGPKVPSFKTEYIVPAFLAAVVLSLLMLISFKLDRGLNYSNPLIFIGVLFGSFVAGAAVPLIRWRADLKNRRLWAFTNSETLETYLRKALLSPRSPREFEWAEGTVAGDEWRGILFGQPDGATVLGAVLQVSYPHRATDAEWSALIQQVVNENGVLINRRLLVQMVELRQLTLDFHTMIDHGGVRIPQVVVIEEVRSWERAGGNPSPLVRPSR